MQPRDYTTPPNVFPASPLKGAPVINNEGQTLGKIEEVVLDLDTGRIAYAVLVFGGFLGLGEKLFAIPWGALRFDHENEQFMLAVPKDMLREEDGFDPNHWPNMADRVWGERVHAQFGYSPYWV
jgi:sporulation protein YlmC with PRC-barrel domain